MDRFDRAILVDVKGWNKRLPLTGRMYQREVTM